MFGFNPEKARKDFPILENMKGVYFDNACMSLRPKSVIEKMNEYYLQYPGCGGRSEHKISKRVGDEVANARREVKRLINALSDKEIVFIKNATEAINLVANGLKLKRGDEVIISDKEHNSNLLPWLKLKKKGIKVKVCESKADNTFNLKAFEKCFSKNTKIVSVVHISNLDGVENPIKDIIRVAHRKNVPVLLDACQSVPHKKIDVKSLDVDYMAFSGHKMLAPSGTGVLYAKKELLENLDSFIVGGGTVYDSTYEDYKPEEIPQRFEAGLQDYSGIIGLGVACRYLRKIGMKNIEGYERRLNKILTEELRMIVSIIGPEDAELRNGIFSFNVPGMKPLIAAKMLDGAGFYVRGGAHCVHSWFNKHEMEGCVRASFYFYNTEDEARRFVEAVKKIVKMVK